MDCKGGKKQGKKLRLSSDRLKIGVDKTISGTNYDYGREMEIKRE